MTAAGANGNDRPAPETALAVLASEHRLSILQAFYEAYEPGTIEVDRSLSFTEIYERTDTTSTAQFSYHVEKLVGRYLTETADGYALTYAGVKLRQALRTGTYTDVPDREAIPIEEDCPVCNTAALEARCAENYVEIYCTDHGDAIGLLPFPPSSIRTRERGVPPRAESLPPIPVRSGDRRDLSGVWRGNRARLRASRRPGSATRRVAPTEL
ncbi:hypothetical protein BRD01_00195 [Halobacteriales archaeon QS_8_65_32]|nr:MAG: hypothetical protein BRD01_00195 [Halobacteriales archaeon QS_8_65_32]